MHDKAFHDYQLARFNAFAKQLCELAAAPGGEGLTALAETADALAARPSTILDDAPQHIARLLTTAPQCAQLFPRDLLWYLGGECLHFMPDEEIEHYSALDEQRRAAAASGTVFNWQAQAVFDVSKSVQ